MVVREGIIEVEIKTRYTRDLLSQFVGHGKKVVKRSRTNQCKIEIL